MNLKDLNLQQGDIFLSHGQYDDDVIICRVTYSGMDTSSRTESDWHIQGKVIRATIYDGPYFNLHEDIEMYCVKITPEDRPELFL